jgi:hypothetical protein
MSASPPLAAVQQCIETYGRGWIEATGEDNAKGLVERALGGQPALSSEPGDEQTLDEVGGSILIDVRPLPRR